MSNQPLFSEDELKAMVLEARGRLVDEMVKSAQDKLSWTIGRALNEEISPVVKEYVQNEIVPELRELLIGQKSVIIDAIVESSNEAGKALAQAFISRLTKNLADSWRAEKIFKALFD